MILENISLIALVSYALFLGVFHAFEADHIAAVTALSSRTRGAKRVAKIGLFWGLGHTLVLFIAGVIVLFLGVSIPDGLSSFFEALVGISLCILGVYIIAKVRREKLHIHTHSHDGKKHMHLHSHQHSSRHTHEHNSLFFGALHGLAGSGAIVLLVIATAHSIIEGLVFIAAFGIGSILSMTCVSFVFGHILEKISEIATLVRTVRYGAGIFSISVGVLLVIQQFPL